MKNHRRVCSTLGIFAAVLAIGFLLSSGNVSAQGASPQSASPTSAAPDQGATQQPARVPLGDEQLGDLHTARKEYDEAVVSYQRALESNPRNAACLNKLGMAYLQLQQFGPALSSFKKSVKADPNYAPAVTIWALSITSASNTPRLSRRTPKLCR